MNFKHVYLFLVLCGAFYWEIYSKHCSCPEATFAFCSHGEKLPRQGGLPAAVQRLSKLPRGNEKLMWTVAGVKPCTEAKLTPGQWVVPGQLTDPKVNFASVHGLTPVTVHMSFLLPRSNFERRVTRCTTPGNPRCRGNFSPCEQNAKVARGKSNLAHAHY